MVIVPTTGECVSKLLTLVTPCDPIRDYEGRVDRSVFRKGRDLMGVEKSANHYRSGATKSLLTGSAHSPFRKTMDAGGVLGGNYNAHNRYSVLRHPLRIIWSVPCTDHPSLGPGPPGWSPDSIGNFPQCNSLVTPVDQRRVTLEG